MSFKWRGEHVGLQAVDETSTTQQHELGLRACGFDSTYGYGEFIYLPGVASTIAGSAVIYDTYAGTTTLTLAASEGPIGIAMSANVASQWGWYQIFGSAVVDTAAGAVANAMVYVTATAGTVDDADVINTQVDNAVFKTAVDTPSTGFAVIQISYPSANSQSED